MIILSCILIIGSKSMTSILTFAVIVYLIALFAIDNKFRTLGIGRTFSVVVIVMSILVFFFVFYLNRDMINSFLLSLGKDASFTGRTDLWSDVLHITKGNRLLGCGFGGFWVIVPSNEILMHLYESYVWLPNQSHMGYLDIFIEVGI